MTSKDLLTLMRAAIRAELRPIVREEIERALNTSVITERKIAATTQKAAQKASPKPEQPKQKQKQYTGNAILNSILNETAQNPMDDGQNYTDFDEWPSMNNNTTENVAPTQQHKQPLFNVNMEEEQGIGTGGHSEPQGDYESELPAVPMDFMNKIVGRAASIVNKSIEKSQNRRP